MIERIALAVSVMAVAAVAAIFYKRRAAARQETLRLSQQQALIEQDERRILDLQPGDVVEYDGESFVIESSLLFDEEGSVWSCHLLDGAEDGATRWLSVNDDDRLEIGLYAVQPAGSVAIDSEPAQSLEVAGVAYSLAEQGTARVRKRDRHGTRDHGRCRYADYKGRNDQRLAIEWWGETTEVAIGQLVSESDLLIMQGA